MAISEDTLVGQVYYELKDDIRINKESLISRGPRILTLEAEVRALKEEVQMLKIGAIDAKSKIETNTRILGGHGEAISLLKQNKLDRPKKSITRF